MISAEIIQARRFSNWPGLHYDSTHNLVLCHTCVKAVESNEISLEKGNIKDPPSSLLDIGKIQL